MSDLYRFGISLDRELLDAFDSHIEEENYKNRSEAIRDLIREELVKKKWRDGNDVAGAITVIYDHHHRDLSNRLMNIQHDFHTIIISTQHIHLDHDNCLEIIAVKGKAALVHDLSTKIKSSKGVLHVKLNMSATGNLHD